MHLDLHMQHLQLTMQPIVGRCQSHHQVQVERPRPDNVSCQFMLPVSQETLCKTEGRRAVTPYM